MRLAREHGVVVLPGYLFGAPAGTSACRWRRSTSTSCARSATAIVAVIDGL